MATHQLQRDEWQSYFDRVSQLLGDQRVEVATATLNLGPEDNIVWAKLHGMVYNAEDDVFEVAAGDIDHVISHPTRIYIDDADTALRTVEVVDEEGNHQIVTLREPMALPPL
jgi:hypothetical protein